MILDSSLHFQLKIIKPLKYYLRLFSIVILGAESNSEVKLHLEWVPVGQKWAFLLYFYFLAFWFWETFLTTFPHVFLDFWPSWCQIKYSEDISQCNFTSRSQIKGQRTYIMGLRGSEVAFLGKKIAKIPYCSKGHSNFCCRLLLWRPPPFNFMNKNWLFSPMQRVGVVGLFSLESFKVDHFSTL